MWAEGHPIPGPLKESLRLYAFAKALKFTHLPNAGGLYDQHPRLIDEWTTIIRVEGEVEYERQEKQRQDMAKQRKQSGSKGRGRRR